MSQPMFDRKMETAAQRLVRAMLAVEEAEKALQAEKDAFMVLVPEGQKYVTKDGDSISHVKSSERDKYLPEVLKKLLTPRIWRAVRVDAVDSKKLRAFMDAGEVQRDRIADGIEIVPVRSSLRVTWAPTVGRVA